MKFKFKITGIFIILFVLTAFITIETRQRIMQEQLDLFGEFYELDHYSHYYDAEETQKQKIAWKGILYAGIGSSVKQTDSGVVITYPYPDMPAMNAGIRTGDLISEINERNVQSLPLDSVVKLLKGNEGDSLWLTIKRPYSGIIKAGMTLKKIIDKAVPLYFLESDSIGYIKLNHFLFGASSTLKNTVTELKARGMKKLVLDIRGNIGGSVEETASALSSLLPVNSLVCSLRLKDSTKNYSNKTLEQPVDTILPIILLIDRKTISSGEIFAGCLKDHKRAILIGERTYGKGLVQGTNYLKNGASLYITEARYYTPSGKFIGDKGVEPDVAINASDSINVEIQAILNSGIITNYCIKQRNTGKNDSSLIDKSFYKGFTPYYLAHLSSVKLLQESFIQGLDVYASAKQLRKEMESRKLKLTNIYSKQVELELQKEMLRQQYQYTSVDKMEFEGSAMFEFLVQRGYLTKKSYE